MRFSSKILTLSFVILMGLAQAVTAHDIDGQAASLANLIERVQPSVVSIQTVDHAAAGAPATGRIGSGVIIDGARGLIVTNHHVVKQATQIYVSLSDERTFLARPVGTDEGEDLAVLRIKADALTALPLAPRGTARVGDFVLAIGNPY